MTKRDAPLISFGSGLPPAGSAVFLKSRFRLYSANPLPRQLNCGSAVCARRCGGACIKRHNYVRRSQRERCSNGLRLTRKRLADEIADKTADDDVLAQFGNFRIKQILDGHIRIFNKALFEQANGVVEFVEFCFDNFVSNVVRYAL